MENSTIKKPTFLIVDDLPISQRAISLLLGSFELNILYASDGREAVELCKENNEIDLILMDISMPIMNGTEAMKAIRMIKHYESLPIIAVTGNISNQEQGKTYLKDGFSNVSPKPVGTEQLISIISEYISLTKKEGE